jgi:hypothetical protein
MTWESSASQHHGSSRDITGFQIGMVQMPNAAYTVELCEALDVGIAELDAGLGVETTPDELMTEISTELVLTNNDRRVLAAQRIRR